MHIWNAVYRPVGSWFQRYAYPLPPPPPHPFLPRSIAVKFTRFSASLQTQTSLVVYQADRVTGSIKSWTCARSEIVPQTAFIHTDVQHSTIIIRSEEFVVIDRFVCAEEVTRDIYSIETRRRINTGRWMDHTAAIAMPGNTEAKYSSSCRCVTSARRQSYCIDTLSCF